LSQPEKNLFATDRMGYKYIGIRSRGDEAMSESYLGYLLDNGIIVLKREEL
jgi:hypothetical protein